MSLRLVKTIPEPGTESRANSARPAVLHLINSFEIGGTERQAVELLKHIDLDRFNVHLAAIHKRGPLFGEVVHRFSEIPEFPLTSFYNANAARQLIRLRALMINKRIRILHAHDFYAGFIGSIAARLCGVKVIACQRHLKLSDRRVHDWGTRLINRLADRILVNSEAIRDHILAARMAPPDRIVVIKNGLRFPENNSSRESDKQTDSLRYQLGLNADAKLVGMVANFLPVKGHRYFINAAGKVARIRSNIHFALVGDGPLRPEIEYQIAQLGITDRVHLLGHREDAASLVASFDLAVLASLREGLPNAVMEAMACGVPVLATSVGGTAELIAEGQTGYLVPPAAAEALAERMLFALGHQDRSAELARRGQQKVAEEFGMKRMVASVEKLYDTLLNNE